jgi:hypothetical protein
MIGRIVHAMIAWLIPNNVGPVKHFLGTLRPSRKRVFSSTSLAAVS